MKFHRKVYTIPGWLLFSLPLVVLLILSNGYWLYHSQSHLLRGNIGQEQLVTLIAEIILIFVILLFMRMWWRDTQQKRIQDLNNVEKKISESEQKFHSLFESISDGIFFLNADGSFADVNRSGYEILGYTKDELISKHVSQIESPEFASTLQDRIDTLLKNGHARFETAHIHKNGTAVPMEVTARIIEISGNTFLLGVNRDISERKKAEESLSYERTILRTLIDNIPDSIYTKDMCSKKTLANTADLRNMGAHSETEVIGKDDFAFYPKEIAEEFLAEDKMVLESGKPIVNKESYFFDKNDEKKWLLTIKLPLRDHNGNIIGLAGVGRDITDRKKIEQMLFKNVQRQTSLVALLQHNSDNVQQFLDMALEEAIKITESKIGYIYHYNETRKEFTLNSWSKDVMKECAITEQQTVYQLEKTGIWGEAVRQRKEIIDNNFHTHHPLKKGYPEGHVPLDKFLTIPFFRGDEIVAVVGVANKIEDYDLPDVIQLKLLMNSIWGKVESIKSEKALRESESKFRTMFEQSTDAMLLLDGKVFFDCNRAAMEMMGCSTKEQMLSIHPAQLSPEFQPDGKFSSQKAEVLMREAFEKGTLRFEWMHRKLDGQDIPVEVMLTSIPIEGRQVLFTVWRDIAERKRGEEMLRQTELFLQKSQSVAQIGSYYLDATTGTWIGSKALNDIFGIDDSYNRNIDGWTSFIHPDDNENMLHYLMKDVLEKHQRFNKEYRIIRHSDGKVRWVHGLGELEFDKQGKTIKMIGTIQDITERKQIEDQLHKFTEDLKRSNTELEQFAYIASHDLQEPLRMVSSYTQLLEKRYNTKLDDDARDFIRFAVDGAQRMQKLIQSLLLYSRMSRERMTFDCVDCNDIIKETITDLQLLVDESQATINYDSLPVIKGQKTLVNQLFLNLINNALKFRKEEAAPYINIGAVQKNGMWEFSVQDNGIGIDPQYYERIFIIFQRLHTNTDYPGTGIGLTICKKIVERHGGRIWLKSSLGSGTTFFFTIPN